MLTREQQESVRKGKPILWNGLTLFPILVSDYFRFLDAKMGLLVSQRTLPVQYACVRFLEALYAMDYDARQDGKPEPGLFLRLLIFLKLALRLPVKKTEDGQEYVELYLATNQQNPRNLIAIKVRQGDVEAEITPKNFGNLREILAAQNGIVLPDETDNPDLVQAELDLLAHNAPNLNPDFEALLYSMAVRLHLNPEELYDWTIRRFQLTENALDRTTGYFVSALVEASGGKYQDGNPYPSWKYDRNKESHALISFSDFTERLSGAVEMKQ